MSKFEPRFKLRPMDTEFLQEMTSRNQMFVITDPSKKDHPIVFASKDFVNFTLYPSDEIVGRNCRFLQGAETDPVDAKQIRAALEEKKDCNLGIVNYKRNGEMFYNQFYMTTLRSKPNIFNKQGKVRYFIGIQFQADKDTFKASAGFVIRNYGKVFRDKQKMVTVKKREAKDA